MASECVVIPRPFTHVTLQNGSSRGKLFQEAEGDHVCALRSERTLDACVRIDIFWTRSPWPPSLPYRKSFSVDSNTVEGRIVAGKNASQMPLYHLAKLETKVVGAATGPGSGLLSLEKSSSVHVESGRCMPRDSCHGFLLATDVLAGTS